MDKRLDKIEEKIDVIVDRIHSIDKTLDRNTTSLETHIKRTNLLEKKLEPIDKHVTLVNGFFRMLLYAAGISGLVTLLINLF